MFPMGRALAVAIAGMLAWAPAASAWGPDPPNIDGFPLNLRAYPAAELRLNVEGTDFTEQIQEGGLNLAIYGEGPAGVTVYGFLGGSDSYLGPEGDMVRVSEPVLSGAGTGSDPWVQTTVYRAGTPAVLEVTQKLSYVNGRPRALLRYAVRNIGAAPVTYRASVAANFFDVGTDGHSEPLSGSAPRLAGNQVRPSGLPGVEHQWGMGESTAWEEVASSPWSHFDVGFFNFVFADVRDAGGPGFDDDPIDHPDDIGAGAQWDDHAPGHPALAPGAAATYEVAVRATNELLATPPGVRRACGERNLVFITTRFGIGGARPGAQIGWELRRNAGAPTERGILRTDASGDAWFAWDCQNEGGIDYLTIWLDVVEDGVFDEEVDLIRPGSEVWWLSAGTEAFPDGGTTAQDAAAAVGAQLPAAATAPAVSRTTSAQLRIGRITRHGRRLRVRGTIAAGATGTVTVAWRARLAGAKVRRRAGVTPRSGRYAARLRLPAGHRSARRARLRVRYGGDARHRPQLVVKRLRATSS